MVIEDRFRTPFLGRRGTNMVCNLYEDASSRVTLNAECAVLAAYAATSIVIVSMSVLYTMDCSLLSYRLERMSWWQGS